MGENNKKQTLKQSNNTINTANKKVYLGMIADIMHPGLINIINEGTKYGDVVIGLFTDKAIATHKRLPYLTYEQRKTVVEHINGVSEVVPQDDWSYVPNLRKYNPDYIIHGDDWVEGPDKYIRSEVFQVMEELGGQVIEIPYTKGITSSGLASEIESLGTTPQARMKSLRRLITAKPIVRIMESHCGLTGLIIEHTKFQEGDATREFDGMWASSLTDSTSKGKPDIEAVDLTTRLHDLNDSLEVTTKPVIYDGDTGGKVEHFVFTVRTLERLGVSAVIIEDKVGLKQNSLFGTDVPQEQETIEAFCHKIAYAKRHLVTDSFMVIARIESLIAGKPVADALERARAYIADGGADGIMIHSKEKDGKEVLEFLRAFRAENAETPVVVVPTTYAQFTEEELQAAGANIVIYANHMLRAAYKAMLETAHEILRTHRALEASERCAPIQDILALVKEAEL